MGLGDAPQQVNLTDIYPEGTPFFIEKAWVEGVVKTQFGDRTMAKIIAKPAGNPAGQAQEFAVWGSLCEQVQQIEEGDVPGHYKVVKDGKRYLFAPVADEELSIPDPTPTGDEEALGVEPQPGEGKQPAAEQPAAAEQTQG